METLDTAAGPLDADVNGAAPPQATARARLLRPVMTALAVSASGTLPAFLTGTMAVQIRTEFDVSQAALSASFSVFFATGGIAAIWGGKVVDRLGWQRSSRLAGLLCSATLLGIPALARSNLGLMALLVLGGLGFALAMPAANLTLAREVPVHRRGIVFAIKHTSIPLTTLFAGVAVPAIALTVGWRWAFAVGSLIPLSILALAPRTVRRAAAASMGPPTQARGVLTPPLIIVVVATAAAATSISALTSHFVASAVELQISEGTAGLLVGTASAVGLCVRLTGGWLADRRHNNGLLGVALLLALGAVGYLMLAARTPVFILPGVVLAYGAGWGWPGLFNHSIVHRHPSAPGRVTGFIQIGMAVGMVSGPLVFSVVADGLGHSVAWLAVSGFAVTGSVLLIIATRLWRQPAKDALTERELQVWTG